MGLNCNKVVWLENGQKIFIRQHNDKTQQGAMVLVNKCIALISVAAADPKIYTKYYKHSNESCAFAIFVDNWAARAQDSTKPFCDFAKSSFFECVFSYKTSEKLKFIYIVVSVLKSCFLTNEKIVYFGSILF